jgi:hypothetical protein
MTNASRVACQLKVGSIQPDDGAMTWSDTHTLARPFADRVGADRGRTVVRCISTHGVGRPR